MSTPQTSSTPHKHPLSPEWIHAITILLNHPFTSEVGQLIQKWIIYKANLNYIKFALKQTLTTSSLLSDGIPYSLKTIRIFKKYEETTGCISYLKSLVNLKIYMTLLISQDRTAAQKNSIYHFILGKQLFKLKAIDMKKVLINLRCKTTPRTLKSKIISHSSSASMWSPIHLEHTPFKIGTKPDDPHQNVDKLHLSACSSTITNLDVTCTLDTSCDHLLHLDSPSHSSDQQDIASVESVEIEFIDESEEPLENNRHPPTDVFHEHHEYYLFLLNQEIDTPSDNVNHQDTHVSENQYDILIHATNLSHTFELPQFMAQHNYEGLKPIDTPTTVPTIIRHLDHYKFE